MAADARDARGAQLGSNNQQINHFYPPDPGFDAERQVVDDDARPDADRPLWLRILRITGKVLVELLMTLWAPIARSGQRPRSDPQDDTPTGRAAGRGRNRRRSASSARSRQARAQSPPWEPRQVLGVVLWVVIVLFAFWQCASPPVPIALPTGPVRLSDDFAAGRAGWTFVGVDQQETPAAVDGDLSLRSSNGALVRATSGALVELDAADVIIEADVLMVDGEGQFGVACRSYTRSGREYFYSFVIRDDGYAGIVKGVEYYPYTSSLASMQPAPAMKPRQANRIVALCRNVSGDVRLELWINGELVRSATDYTEPLIRGVVRFFSQASKGQELDVTFDNLVIKTPG